ncbi:hypothetical protein Gpo141_00000637 [Globisporangium polare]
MGAAKSKAGERESDLSEEQLEEIRMLTSLPVKEILHIRRKYRAIAQHEDMTRDEFYTLPAIAVNPLRDRLFASLELSETKTIPFAEFAKFVSTFSYHSSQEAKRREAFRIHDFDGDGKISRADLRSYLDIVYQKTAEDDVDPEAAEKSHHEVLELLISRIMEEASSDPAMEVLFYEDFVKVIQSTDFESRLVLQF